MAPHLAKSQHELIRDMNSTGSFTDPEIAKAACCSTRSVRSNIRYFGIPKAPWNGGGRRRSITPPMLDALCEHLLEKPGLYQYEMVIFLWDKFHTLVLTSSIQRALHLKG
jgi:hypothetical protein